MELEKTVKDYNFTMEYAAARGNIKIVKLMISRGANDFNAAKKAAATNGHEDVVKLMIEKGVIDSLKVKDVKPGQFFKCKILEEETYFLKLAQGTTEYNVVNFSSHFPAIMNEDMEVEGPFQVSSMILDPLPLP